MNKRTKGDHYCPQFYQKPWCDKEEKLWCLDKKENRVFQSRPKNIGVLNDAELSDRPNQNPELLRNIIREIDNKCCKSIKYTIDNEKIPEDSELYTWFIFFIAFQDVRSPYTKEKHKRFQEGTAQKFIDMYSPGNYTVNIVGNTGLVSQQINLAKDLAPEYAEWTWKLRKTPKNLPKLITSDTPVILIAPKFKIIPISPNIILMGSIYINGMQEYSSYLGYKEIINCNNAQYEYTEGRFIISTDKKQLEKYLKI